LVHDPPHNTRAWTRAHLLKLTSNRDVDTLDWNLMRFSLPNADGPPHFRHYTVNLDNPLRFTRAETLPRLPESATLQDVLEIFDDPDPVAMTPVTVRDNAG
jgi:hypothetical protein